MRVLGVVTLVSPTGEYGGPLRVAVNQLTALRERGHDVVLAGAHRGYAGEAPRAFEGVPARLFAAQTILPGTGFAGIGAPALWRALRRHAREFDVVHVHAARDLVTLPAARIAQGLGVPTVLQSHGMIDESAHPLAGAVDAALTRPALAAARHVTYLTAHERRALEHTSRGAARLAELANGVPLADPPAPSHASPRVLYLARLAKRKRPLLFVEAARRVAVDFPDAQFTLVGPDEGEGPAVRAAIAASGLSDRITWAGAAGPDETLAHMRNASIYVLPSVDEPYPMTVLEAMSVGLPVVVTHTCGLARFVTEAGAGLVVDDSLDDLERGLRRLLASPVEAAAHGAAGRAAVRRDRSMSAIAQRLESLYATPSEIDERTAPFIR